MKSMRRKLRGFAPQRHEQRVDRDRDHARGHSTAAATVAEEHLLATQDMADMRSSYDNLLSVAPAIANSAYGMQAMYRNDNIEIVDGCLNIEVV